MSSSRRRGAFLSLLLVLILAVASQGAADPLNVDFTVGWDGCYRPMEWTPVEIGISYTLKEPLGGVLQISAQQDSLTVMNVSHRIVLQKDLPLHLPLVTKLAAGTTNCDVSITDDNGRSRWSNQYQLVDFSSAEQSIRAIGVEDALVGLVGKRALGLVQMGTTTHCTASTPTSDSPAQTGHVYVKDKLVQYLPWDWTGYASLDVLVLYNPDWDLINAAQSKAIRQWVSNGGKVLLVLGSRPLPATHPLAEMLPLKIGEPRKLELRPDDLPFGGWVPPSTVGTVTAWVLEGLRDENWKLEFFGAAAVLAQGPVGFGRAAVFAMDPTESTELFPSASSEVWAWCMKDLAAERKIENGKPPGDSDSSAMPGGGFGPGGPYGYRRLQFGDLRAGHQ